MSQENVEIVRSIYAAWERGDYSYTEDGSDRRRLRSRARPLPEELYAGSGVGR